MLRKELRNKKFRQFFFEKELQVLFALFGEKRICRDVSKIRKVCVISWRYRGIMSKFKLSRICFREFIGFGFLNGVRKISW